MTTVDRLQRGQAKTTNTIADPAKALALVKQLQGRQLDRGTASLVAQLATALRGAEASEKQNVEQVTLRLSTRDELHYGFTENAEDISARLGQDSDARLEITVVNRNDQYDFTMEVSGTPDAVAKVKTEVGRAAAGVVDLTWRPIE